MRPVRDTKTGPSPTGPFLSPLSSLLPLLAIVPIVDFLPRLVLCIAVTLLQASFELILISGDHVEIVVCQLAPLLLYLALHLLPVSLDPIPVHGYLLLR